MEPPALVHREGACYAFRITHTFDRLVSLFSTLMTYCDALAVVEHKEEGKRTHIHASMVNAYVSHKRIKQVIQERFSIDSPVILEEIKGAGNFSLKQWDSKSRYLVYMIKGKYSLLYNQRKVDGPGSETTTWIVPEEYERLRLLWKSESIAENEYSEFKASSFCPKPPVERELTDHELTQLMTNKSFKNPNKLHFEEVKDGAIKYILNKYGGFITAKNRFLIKDLVSNFCLFNKIKIECYYI